MADRRRLIEGLTRTPTEEEQAFINGTLGKQESPEPKPATQSPAASVQGNTPLSTRIRSDLASALKRASLERQLSGVEPNTVKDILEEAIEPWLKSNNYI